MDREELAAKDLPAGGEIPDVTEEDIAQANPDAAPYSLNAEPDNVNLDDKPEPESTSKPDTGTPETKAAPAAPQAASFKELFSYSPPSDRLAFNFGCFCSLIDGLFQPSYALLIGLALELFNPHQTPEEAE